MHICKTFEFIFSLLCILYGFPTLLTTSSLHIYSSFCRHLRVGRAEGDYLLVAGAYYLISVFGIEYTVIVV